MPGHARTGGRDVIFAWEQCKLGDVAKINSGKDYKGLQPGKIPVYGTGGYMLSVNDKLSDIDAIGIGRKGTIDKPYYLNAPFWTVDTLFYVTPRGTADISFMFPLFKNINWKRYDESTGVPSLSKNTIKKIRVSFPQNNEQVKIGDLFQKITQIITLHEEKKRQLERLKSALLQKMFADKSGYPVVRFKGFCDEWQGTKLRKISKIVRGASPRPISDPKWFDNDSSVGWLRISDVTSQDGRIHHLEQHISKQGQAKTRVISEPHLLLSIAATVGKPLINYVKTGVHDGFLIFIEPQFDLEFMFQWLEMFRPQWSKYGQPGSQINLNSDLVKNQIIYLPSREEQNQIGIFLNQIDSLINLHQQKINNINSVKKSLLQKMFI
ncbi:restriction endonuclease subunit S [Lactobacillus delbrueckii subsp. bulgaricus]|nr:restriction endonuclease subunit S [Lactobacillus delbrueckii subsp. bulgaricus]